MWKYLGIICSVFFFFEFTGLSYGQDSKIQQIIDSNRMQFAPDRRTAIDQVDVLTSEGKIVLKGITDNPAAKKALTDSLKAFNVSFIDSINVLPDASLGDQIWGLTTLSVSNMRVHPAEAAEMATQALMGMPLKVLEYKNGWYRVQTPDQYIGWMESTGLKRMTESELNRWKKSNRYVFNQISGNAFDSPDRKATEISDLVLGDIFEVLSETKGFLKIQIPDGRVGYVRKKDCIRIEEWANIKPEAPAVISTAKKLLGLPYLWGGTSTKSVDCSGLVKTSYYSQGVILARDASQQARYGNHPDFSDFHNLQPGDLLFFGRSAQHITHVALFMGDGRFIHSSGFVHINSLDPNDQLFSSSLLKILVASGRVLNSLNTEEIVQVKNHPWYFVNNQK